MSETNLVRASRDGDQFHYTWAARRCLLLLSPGASLRAITIEGASPSEAAAKDRVTTGEELIDIGEYYGSESLEQATLIRYIQVKHSTLRTDRAWTPSDLKKTLKGFAARYMALLQHLNTKDLDGKLEFWFVSNRPINTDFLEAIHDAAEGISARHVDDLKKLERFTSLSGTALASFCKLLRLEGNQEGLWDQQNILAQDVSYYLVDADVDAPVQLKELVTKKALSASANNPTITKMDVLRALKTDESRLFPGPCLIRDLENPVSREQEPELFQAIVQANGIPIIIHAAGGVGKSVFATRIKLGLPAGSSSVLYDCFGNGQYRSASGYRHRHKDALAQIANELAAKGLCHPLIPSPHAEPSAYVRAFIYRLRQSIASLRSKNPEALLCIIIDAADNAQMAAEEIGEARSFVRDLIREQLPEGVRLVALCRTHRQEYLDPPPGTLRLELKPFSRAETATYLRQVFADATEQDLDEFHRLSSQNPRVQALALSRKAPLSEILRALGPNPTTVEDTIGSLLDNSIARLRDAAGAVEKIQIDKICAGLAALRPLIPLSVLASISGVDEAAIKSLAFDLGRPLLVTGNMIQFFDEPAETWFRDRFKPTTGDLAAFVASLKPLAASSAYVASALPQLMLEAGHIAELVALALSSEALPSTSPVEKRDIELQRLQFALKASLRAKRYTDAAKLALKAGGESAGDERQRKLLQANTDLAAVFLESDRIQELVSRRTFGSGWVGSHHAYEAALLSGRSELLGEARSRFRMAREWLRNWSQLSPEERQREEVSDNDILEMATAFFNIHGANSCAYELRGWRPREVSFRVGRILAKRFIDHGRYQDLNELALAAGNDLCLILAITLELREVHRVPPKSVVERAFRLALNPRIKLKDGSRWDSEGTTIWAVTALVEAAYKLSVGTVDALISLLTRYLPASPPRGLSSRYDRERFPLLRAYALRAALSNQSLDLIDLAHDELRKELEAPRPYSESQDVREFKENIGSLLPWHRLWATTFLGRTSPADLANAIAETKAESAKAKEISYREESDTSDEIARVWFDTLLTAENTDAASVDVFDQWIASLKRPLFTTTLTHLARLAARSPSLEARALDYAGKAFSLFQDAREDAQLKSDAYVELARAVLMVSRSEAAAYFNQAMEVASKIGDENLDRWGALLDLADRAASRDKPNPVIAYRLARCALHARQWLLIGLARAAKDRPNLVAPYADFLIKLAFAGEPHVLIREFAKRTILALLDAGFLESQADLRHRLAVINTSPFPPVESKSYRRFENGETDDKTKVGNEGDEDRFYFGIDIGPYWFAPLGSCFAKSPASIEREALRVIRNDWKLSGGNRWDEDERHRRKIFRDMETYHHQGSYPRVDELRFYLSYHAMMVVAGKLLATTPVHHDPDDSEDEFHNWLSRHDLSRHDDGWLADRRDPIPLERPAWKDEKETDDWRWSIARNDFDRILIAPDGRMNLWGRWTWVSGHREESIHVYSALVSSDRSMALLRALQSVDNPHDYRIPDADDDLQIDFDGFQLKGWIVDRSCDSGLDEQDPWAGAIRYPPPELAAYIIELMKLNSDAEHRRWFVQGDCIDVAWSQIWGHFQDKDDDETNYESGERFQASFEFIISLLHELEMDLIVEIEIERRLRYSRWERSNDDDIGFIPPSARLFLIKSDGSIRTL